MCPEAVTQEVKRSGLAAAENTGAHQIRSCQRAPSLRKRPHSKEREREGDPGEQVVDLSHF